MYADGIGNVRVAGTMENRSINCSPDTDDGGKPVLQKKGNYNAIQLLELPIKMC